MVHIGVDIGGTNICVGAVDKNYKIISKRSCKTNVPRPGIEISLDIVNLIHEVLNDLSMTLNDIAYVGVGCPGTVNKETGIIEFSANLFLHNWPIISQLENILKKQVKIENDANAAAYGECLAGSAKGKQNAIAITLGTGVGSGIIIDGKIYSGSNYAGAEIGHMVIVHDGRQCACGRKGCFETYASATGLIKTTKKFMLRQKNQKTLLWEMFKKNQKISGRNAFQAAKNNDKIGQLIVNKYISQLACGLTNIINIFQPDVMCIGGGVSKESDEFLLEPLKKIIACQRYSRYSEKQTQIVKATLGNDAGVIGASML